MVTVSRHPDVSSPRGLVAANLSVKPLLEPNLAIAGDLVAVIEAQQHAVLGLRVDVHLVMGDRPLDIRVAGSIQDHLQSLGEEPASVV